ncbi:hypothetical protein Mterra_00800 [Calidithermus terrae]|uniref:EamA-like transporter family protein n=2 Tax=Calidithermus terrae TaxID=1408545 RepID=A0A399F1R3_9DEIN|nr:hypothetical protein Mterra_00800 [Calidithermus terrae]
MYTVYTFPAGRKLALSSTVRGVKLWAMSLYLFSIGLVVASIVLYQIAQRSMPHALNPFYALIFVYALGIVVCTVALFFYPADRSPGSFLRGMNWAPAALALAVVGLELGYLLAYRAGWNLALAPIVANVAALFLLVPIGLIFFREQLTAVRAVGLLLCLVGFVLATRR